MMPRKKRIVIIVISIILVIALITGGLIFLYLETDAFKSKDTLFAKYLLQNFNVVENLETEKATDISTALNNNKYTSELNGKIEYTENISTSDENKNNPINDVELNIDSKTDKLDNYYYKDIKVIQDDENLIRAEYLNKDDTYGIRLDGIKQFVSIENKNLDKLSKEINIDNLEGVFEKIDFNSVFSFSDDEKENLKNTYLSVLQSNISKDKYYKQSKAVITINNKDVQTNAYYIKMTIEEYNDLYVKILQKLSNDPIILSKIDNLELIINKKYKTEKEEGYLKKEFIEEINKKIEEIQNNNIGQDEVKITVYENNMRTVRTTIEKTTNKITLDVYNNNTAIKIDNLEIGDSQTEQILKIEKDGSTSEENVLVEYEKMSNNEIENDIQINFKQNMQNSNIMKNVKLDIANQKYKSSFIIEDNIKVVNEFEDEITLDTDNIVINDLEEEKVNTILNILMQNISGQIEKLNSKVSVNEYVKMFQNLQVMKQNSIQISDTATVTETEKNRFNSQFEFFKSQNLNVDNMKELLDACKDNLEDIKIVFESGEVGDLDVDKVDDSNNNEDAKEYQDSIKGINIIIKQNSSNEDKRNDLLKLLEIFDNKKYNVGLDYNENNGLVKSINIEIVKE